MRFHTFRESNENAVTQLHHKCRILWPRTVGNYDDRKTSAFVDRYSSQISDMVTKYIRPQENGHYVDINWLALTHLRVKDTVCCR